MSGVSGHDRLALRAVFDADQGAGAVAEAQDLLALAATADGRAVDRTGRPSGWALRLLREARRRRCSHAPREGLELVFVPAHVRQLLCRSCARRAAARLVESADAVRCDVCREPVELQRFMLQVGSLLVTGRCCAGCRVTVYGPDAAGGH